MGLREFRSPNDQYVAIQGLQDGRGGAAYEHAAPLMRRGAYDHQVGVGFLHHVLQAIVRRTHFDVQMLRRHAVRAAQAFHLAVSERVLDLQGRSVVA